MLGYVKNALSTNETIILRRRKHAIVLLWPFSYNLLLLILIVFAASAAAIAEPKLLVALLIFALGVFPMCFLIYSCLKWWTEEFYLTTHRVIQSEGIINKRVTESSLEKVNDVVLWQSFIGRILDFGDLKILTASDISTNDLRMLKSPVPFKTAMLNQKETFSSDKHTPAADEAAAESKGRISGLEKLRQEGAITETEFLEKKTQLLAQMQ
ncbi:MAG TPA: PH domain-containing protein [Oligoflexia bacterium]|nr:PH domain-containing protein [Oligoflexia bacterium]